MKINCTKISLLLALLFTTMRVNAQFASGIPHLFSVGATATFPASGNANLYASLTALDEWDTLIAPPAFNFTFAGVTYTKLVVSTNGWVALVPNSFATIPPVFIGNAIQNNVLANNTTGFPIVAPLWDDLSVGAITWNYATANIVWIRWTVKWQKTSGAAASSLFFLKLDAGSNTINFNYASTAYTPTTPSASIGIAGVCPGDFYSCSPTSATTATIDSVTENINVGQGGATTFRPANIAYTFTPYSLGNNCANPKDFGIISSTCTTTTVSTINAATSGTGMCIGSDVKDVFYKFTKPAGVAGISVTTSPATCNSVAGTSVELLSACGGTVLGCSNTSAANATFGEIILSTPCALTTYWVRVTALNDVDGKFNICIKTVGGSGGGQTCASATPVCSPLPYTQNGLTTAGSGNDFDSTSSACHSIYMDGEDYVFSYTPSTNECIRVSVTSAGQNPGVFIYSGCPNAPGVYCLGSAEVTTGTATINSTSLLNGNTYYIVVDNSITAGNTFIPFNISVTSVGTANAYDNCASAVNLGTVAINTSCIPQTYSTECSTPTAVGVAGIPSCVPAHNPPYFIDGVTGDVWLKFTAGFTGALQINTYRSAINPTSNAAMAIYSGATCPSGASAPYACDYNSGSNGMPSLSIPVINGTTYYIRVWSEHPENQGNFDICFQSSCSPPNDLPCGAIFCPIGGIVPGYNTCAGSTGEPANAAQCTVGGTINTVWFKTVVPASGQVRVRTHPLTLTDTQIQGYSFGTGPGSCSNATNTPRTCNDDGVACDNGFNDFSDQIFTGLTPNDTFWVAVDGVNSLTGTFDITIIDGTSTTFPPVLQQDCANPQIVCSTSDIVVADPGNRNNGNICDLGPGTYGCWGTGERNSVWYQFTVDPALTGGNASIQFDVFSLPGTDIDLLMWDVTGNPNACAQIQNHTLPIAACNYFPANSQTGVKSPPPSGYYAPAVTFSGAPRTYLLLLNNWNSAANAGYTLQWVGSPPPISTLSSNSIWTGASDSQYQTPDNWGTCGTRPTCGIDATVNATANGRQPIITGAEAVKNITISAGATLVIQTGGSLDVCGNFTNLGTLICQPGSTINFVGGSLQTITGALTGANGFANLVINKTGGSVLLQTNIDVKENFTISNANSVFNFNAKYMKVAGDYTNYNNATTIGTFGSTLEFNGTANQTYLVTTTQADTLHRVTINKTGGNVILGANSSMNIDSVLTLTSGNIVTGNTLEVFCKSASTGAVTGHNINSYVQGRLHRKVFPFASLDFPVGDPLVPNAGAQKGYEMANITFTLSTAIADIVSWFNLWPGPVPNGPTGLDFCQTFTTQWDLLPILDNGYWSFQRLSASSNGGYNVNLHNTGGTNATGTNWSVTHSPLLANVSLQASWSTLYGQCQNTSTMAIDRRNSFNNPFIAGGAASFNMNFAAVQSTVVLPVELLYFTAEPSGEEVICKWETSSETNNDYFEVQRSIDGKNFEKLGKVQGYGHGSSTTKRAYSFIDPQACKEIRYYRLKQVDIDGHYNFTETVAVNCKIKTGLDVYPNPADNTITYQFDQSFDGKAIISIVDIAGRQIYVEQVDGKKGINQITTNISQLASGVYYLRISKADSVGEMLQTKFFKN